MAVVKCNRGRDSKVASTRRLAGHSSFGTCIRRPLPCLLKRSAYYLPPPSCLTLSTVTAPHSTLQQCGGARSAGTPHTKISASRFYGFRSWAKTWERGSTGTQKCCFWSGSPHAPRDKAAHDHCLVYECSRQCAIFVCCVALFCGDSCSAGSCRLYLSVHSSRLPQAALHDARRYPQHWRPGP